MRKSLICIAIAAIFGLASVSTSIAQDERAMAAAGQSYLISAKAGSVNLVEGGVAVARATGTSGLLLKTDNLKVGDVISTGANGKAEILLNPGSFVRLGGNSKFEFLSVDLDTLKLKLTAGSAILEVFASDDLKVPLELPSTTVEFSNSGVYRVDVLADGSGKISVWKGRFLIGGKGNEVKEGRFVVVGSKTGAVAKFDRDGRDELDVWSQLRGKEAAKVNEKLKRDALRNSLIGAYGQGQWNVFNTLGVWVFDLGTARWCFLPFGSGWRSPYGHYLGFDLEYLRLPVRYYVEPPVVGPPVVTPTNGDQRDPNRPKRRYLEFEEDQRIGRGGGGGIVNDVDNGSGTGIIAPDRNNSDPRDTKGSQPSANPTNQSAPIIVMPSRQDTKDVKDN